MADRHRGRTEAIADFLVEGARVCLDRHHESPVDFTIDKSGRQTRAVAEWEHTVERTRDAWRNEIDTTEAGACACTLAAVELSVGLVAVHRAETRTGAEYYVAPAGATIEDLEDCIRLEVSGVDRGNLGSVSRRLIEKINQVRSGDSNLPAMAGVTGFRCRIWSEKAREQAGVQFAPGQVMVAVKGGEIVEGGAPLDLIIDKVKTVQSLFYRTTELMKGLPHRKRGGPVKKIQESCRPWLFQAVPGSYQFAVAVQEPQQPELDMFEATDPRPKEIADKFLDILKASIESPEDTLPDVVQDADYRDTFLKLTRSLAPTGKGFNQLDIRSTAENSTITLDPTTRAVVTAAIRKHRSSSCAEPEPESKTEQIRGILRALHLDRDWIEILEGTERIKIDQVGEAVSRCAPASSATRSRIWSASTAMRAT